MNPAVGKAGDPRADSYDVVVVGAGLAGLVAAGMLAKSGRTVLVVDQADGPGGYAHGFQRGPYIFDPAVHVLADGPFVNILFEHLGHPEPCNFIRVNAFYEGHFPDGHSFRAPLGFEEYLDAHLAGFPHQEQELRSFLRLAAQVHHEAHQLPPQLSLKELDAAAARFPTLFESQKLTLGEVMDAHLTDERLKAVCSALWPYPGLPPSRVSFLTLSQILNVHLAGAYYVEGSFQRLADAFAAALENLGGELVLGRRVDKITVEDGSAAGVVLDDGEVVRAPVVVSNADALRTFEELVGEEHLPESLLRRVRRMEPSTSAFVVFGATKLDLAELDVAHETFLYKHWDHDETYRDVLEGRPGGMWMNTPTIADPSLAPPGEHIVIFTALAPYDRPWEQERERYATELVREFDAVVPGLSESVEVLETATPVTLERFALNQGGANYGWANTPRQTESRRLSHVTPIKGLFLAGHWTQPGTGSIRVIVSGLHTAIIVIAMAGEQPPMLRREADMPPVW